MLPLIGFIVLVIDLFIWIVIASAILSWLVAFNVVNTNNRVVLTIGDMLYRLTEPALRPIRSILPNLGGIDISPVILHPAAPVHPRRGAARLDRADVRSASLSLSANKPLALPLRPSRDGVILPVRLTPKSSRDEIVGVEDHGGECVLKARVRAIPEAGRANDGARNADRALARRAAVHGQRGPWRQVAAEAGRGGGRCGCVVAPDRSACR